MPTPTYRTSNGTLVLDAQLLVFVASAAARSEAARISVAVRDGLSIPLRSRGYFVTDIPSERDVSITVALRGEQSTVTVRSPPRGVAAMVVADAPEGSRRLRLDWAASASIDPDANPRAVELYVDLGLEGAVFCRGQSVRLTMAARNWHTGHPHVLQPVVLADDEHTTFTVRSAALGAHTCSGAVLAYGTIGRSAGRRILLVTIAPDPHGEDEGATLTRCVWSADGIFDGCRTMTPDRHH